MRPEVLVMSGLRSYRDETTIDFADLGLVALIGDTGAGKSSIIEALSVALYNRPTWSGRAVQALRADNADAMRVILTFSVSDGAKCERWTVTRIHRSGTAASVHKLECVDTGEKVDSERLINDRIEGLIGLNHEQYTKAVAIPQGQFAKLLEATASERTKILKGIFRLGHLTAIKDHADVLHRRYSPGILERSGRRRGLPDDPAAELAAVQARSSSARVRAEGLVSAVGDAQSRKTAADNANAQIVVLTAAAGEVTERLAEDRRKALLCAADAEADITAALKAAEAARADSEADGTTAAAEVVAALAPFASRDDAVEARSVLQATAGQALTFESRRGALARVETDLDEPSKERALVDARSTATELRANAVLASSAAAAKAAELRAADDVAAKARAALASANKTLRGLERKAAEVRQTLHAAIEANALASIAGQCEPGDPCPICTQILPTSFEAPSDPGIDDARAQLAAAESGIDTARNNIDEATEKQTAAEGDAAAAQQAADEANTTAMSTDRSANAAERNADDLEADDRRARTKLAQDKDSLTGDIARAQAALQGLPAPFVVRLEDRDATAAALDAIAERLTASDERLAAVDIAKAAEARALSESATIRARLDDEVRRPLAQARERAVGLASAIARLAPHLPAFEQPSIDPGVVASVNAILDWVDSLEAASAAAVARATAAIDELNAVGVSEAAALDAACAAAGATDLDTLVELRLEAERQAAVAQSQIERARVEVETARLLDEFLDIGIPFLANLDTLGQTLTDAKFVRILAAERERELLVVASVKLRELSGDNFGYAEGFQIVDRRTGQHRTPETLSGGERFLASLALALGLVEIATRGGGKLDALFLDEGFGSLDAASLDQALSSLGSLSGGGKLVVLVSHLRQVAEHVEQVLFVTRDDTAGSRIELLSAEARDRLLEDDVRSGLTF